MWRVSSCVAKRLHAVFVLFLAAFAATSVIIFGVENKNKFDRNDKKGYYDWAYYVALATGAFGALATIFAGLSISAMRKGSRITKQ